MNGSREWRADRTKILDGEVLRTSLLKALASQGGVLGTGKVAPSEPLALKVLDLILTETTDGEGRIHLDTVLSTFGALAGFSAQMAVREYFIREGKINASAALKLIRGGDGQTYCLSDLATELLAEVKDGQLSVWVFVAGAAQRMGAVTLPDVGELCRHVNKTFREGVGFGIPRLPPQHMPHALPIDLLNDFWNPVRNMLLLESRDPSAWPFLLGQATQIAMLRGQGAIDPCLAATLVMEAAIPMSVIDPARVRRSFVER